MPQGLHAHELSAKTQLWDQGCFPPWLWPPCWALALPASIECAHECAHVHKGVEEPGMWKGVEEPGMWLLCPAVPAPWHCSLIFLVFTIDMQDGTVSEKAIQW